MHNNYIFVFGRPGCRFTINAISYLHQFPFRYITHDKSEGDLSKVVNFYCKHKIKHKINLGAKTYPRVVVLTEGSEEYVIMDSIATKGWAEKVNSHQTFALDHSQKVEYVYAISDAKNSAGRGKCFAYQKEKRNSRNNCPRTAKGGTCAP